MLLTLCLIVQCLAAAVIVFGDIGFDHPGRFGLHFDHFIVVSLLYLIALITGIVVCARRRQRVWLSLQLLFPVALVVACVVLAAFAMTPIAPIASR